MSLDKKKLSKEQRIQCLDVFSLLDGPHCHALLMDDKFCRVSWCMSHVCVSFVSLDLLFQLFIDVFYDICGEASVT